MLVIFGFLVFTLAGARVTRLITVDQIFFWLRRATVNRLGEKHWLTYLLHCPYCVSVWVSFIAAAGWVLAFPISWWWWLPAALAMSHLIAPILLTFESED